MRYANRQHALLPCVLVRIAASVHHSRPAELGSRYARIEEQEGRGQALRSDGGAHEGVGVGFGRR